MGLQLLELFGINEAYIYVLSNSIRHDINVDRVEKRWIFFFFSSASKGICELSRVCCIAASLKILLFFAININMFFWLFLSIANSDLYNWQKAVPLAR